MNIHLLNCFTCNARFSPKMKTGMLCLLVETDSGPVLVDTGLGLRDYSDPTWFTQFFRVITDMPFDSREAAVNRVKHLGYKPEEVRHIILTHMHFDHCGGLPDFPHAKIHVHKREYDAFTGRALIGAMPPISSETSLTSLKLHFMKRSNQNGTTLTPSDSHFRRRCT